VYIKKENKFVQHLKKLDAYNVEEVANDGSCAIYAFLTCLKKQGIKTDNKDLDQLVKNFKVGKSENNTEVAKQFRILLENYIRKQEKADKLKFLSAAGEKNVEFLPRLTTAREERLKRQFESEAARQYDNGSYRINIPGLEEEPSREQTIQGYVNEHLENKRKTMNYEEDEYYTHLKNLKFFLRTAELDAMARMSGVDIVVKSGDEVSVSSANKEKSKTISLVHVNGNHFDAIPVTQGNLKIAQKEQKSWLSIGMSGIASLIRGIVTFVSEKVGGNSVAAAVGAIPVAAAVYTKDENEAAILAQANRFAQAMGLPEAPDYAQMKTAVDLINVADVDGAEAQAVVTGLKAAIAENDKIIFDPAEAKNKTLALTNAVNAHALYIKKEANQDAILAQVNTLVDKDTTLPLWLIVAKGGTYADLKDVLARNLSTGSDEPEALTTLRAAVAENDKTVFNPAAAKTATDAFTQAVADHDSLTIGVQVGLTSGAVDLAWKALYKAFEKEKTTLNSMYNTIPPVSRRFTHIKPLYNVAGTPADPGMKLFGEDNTTRTGKDKGPTTNIQANKTTSGFTLSAPATDDNVKEMTNVIKEAIKDKACYDLDFVIQKCPGGLAGMKKTIALMEGNPKLKLHDDVIQKFKRFETATDPSEQAAYEKFDRLVHDGRHQHLPPRAATAPR